MRNKKSAEPRWILKVRDGARRNSPRDADENDPEFEHVDKNLVTTIFIEAILDEVEGKTITSPLVISIPDLLDDEFLSRHVECLHAVMVACLIKLFDTNRIVIREEE